MCIANVATLLVLYTFLFLARRTVLVNPERERERERGG
jgi:hypothetical protein